MAPNYRSQIISRNGPVLSVRRIAIIIFIVIIQYFKLSHQQSSISLNSAQWFVSNTNKSISLPAQVPGGIYTDLRRNKLLKQDILYGKNDQVYRWVGYENWTYYTSFTIDDYIARSQSVKLVLHGVDTVSSVFLNGHEIGTTDNMFVRYRFDIKPHLKLAGLENFLALRFESPIKYAARRSLRSLKTNKNKVIPPYCPVGAQKGECHINFIRKMQASFSWDWGPAFPSMGIYKNIEIEYGSFGQIRDILVDTRRIAPLIPPMSPSTSPTPIIIRNIRQRVRHANNRTVPLSPPFYMPDIPGDDRHLLVGRQPITPNQMSIFDMNQQLHEEKWLLNITLVAEMVRPSFGYNMRIEFSLDGVLHYESEHINVVAHTDGCIRLGFNLKIDTSRLKIKPWWPNNAGDQNLYRLTARMFPIPDPQARNRHQRQLADQYFIGGQNASEEEHPPLQYRFRPQRDPGPQSEMFMASQQDMFFNQVQHVSEKEITFGFRTVELIQEPVTKEFPTDGITFNFRINGVDMFAMGTNWIPSSILPENSNDIAYIRYLLQSVKDANMNMIRVWGGGMYESDEFYKIADEMGIMVWHDLMFACALYPVDDEFFASIRLEVEQQVQRLQHHPSIVIWSGNNENEMALTGPWWTEVAIWSKTLRDHYGKLYVDLIKPIVQILDPTRPYVESSPSNGPLSSTQPNAIGRVPNNNRYGDVHHYDYFADSFEWTSYPSARFVSEYGFQSWSSFNSLTSVSSSNDWKYPISGSLTHRQHRATGDFEMKLQLRSHFTEPDPGGTDKLKSFIYLSQLTQAIAIKIETEFYRRNRFIDPETKLGKTMGALYWQLNDVWQGPTWSSIEYGGKWKMLHYFARRFFFPIQVIPYLIQPSQSAGERIGGIIQQVVSTGSGMISSAFNRSSLFPSSLSSSSLLDNNQDTIMGSHHQQQPPQSVGPLFVVDLVRDDLFYLLDSFDITIKFYRFNSFAPVWQDSICVKNTRPQNVTRIYEQDLQRIARLPGIISISSGVFRVIIEQQSHLGLSQIDNYLMPVNPQKVTAMRVAKIVADHIQGPFKMADIRPPPLDNRVKSAERLSHTQLWECGYRITLSTDAIAMYVWLDLNFINVEPSEHGRAPGDSFDTYDQVPTARPSPVSEIIRPTNGDRPTPPEHIRLHLDPERPRGQRINSGGGGEYGEPAVVQDSYNPLPNTGSRILRYQFSDNAFNMFEPAKVIDLYLSRCLTKQQVEAALEIQSLANNL